MITQESIEELKERVSLVTVVQDLVALKRQGGRHVGLCPFHSEKTPSFHLRDDKWYHCFGCGASGNAITFVMQTRGLTFPEAIEDLAQRFGVVLKRHGGNRKESGTIPKTALLAVQSLAQSFFVASLGAAPAIVKNYVESRALSKEAVAAFGIGFSPLSWHGLSDYLKQKKVPEEIALASGLVRRSSRGELIDTFRGRLMFPICADARHVIGFGGRLIPGLEENSEDKGNPKYINSSESPIYRKSRVFFGLPQSLTAIREKKSVILVEGYLDVIGLWQVGVRNVLATCGTALTAEHLARLLRLGPKVEILFDGDNAGMTAAGKVFQLFLNSGLDGRVRFLPAGEDPDTFALKEKSDTEKKLEALPAVSLLSCYIDSLIRTEGVDSVGALSPVRKGAIGTDIAKLLAQVRNDLERLELVRQAAKILRVEELQLLRLTQGQSLSPRAGASTGSSQQTNSAGVGSVKSVGSVNGSVADGATSQIAISSLPALDLEVLRCVIALKGRVLNDVLRIQDLALSLTPRTLALLSAMLEARSNIANDDTIFYQIGELLIEGWRGFVRQSLAMGDDAGVDFSKSLQQCLLAAEKHRKGLAITAIEERIRNTDDAEDKLMLQRELIEARRKTVNS